MSTEIVKEIWDRKVILDFCAIMGWHDLMTSIEAMRTEPEKVFTDKLKHGDVQITLYRKTDTASFDEACPFYFTEDCK